MCWYSRVQACNMANRDKRRWRKMSPMVDKPDRWSTSALETWTHQHTSIVDTSCGNKTSSVFISCRPPRGFLFPWLRAEHTLWVIGVLVMSVLLCWYWYYCNSIHSVENSSLNKQASPILRRTSGRQQPLELLTAKVDELLYSFNWYTIYEACWWRSSAPTFWSFVFGHDRYPV